MKLYDEKEIGAILKKAAENSRGDKSDMSVGLSIDELQQLASDAGIDPEQIIKAAAEIDAEPKEAESLFWGGPFSFNSQVMVEGEITAGEWEEMLVSIRECFKSKGEVSTRDSTTEWSSPWGTTNSAHVTALREDGKTKISLFWNGPLTALPFYIPVPLVAIASIPIAAEFLGLSAIPGMSFVLLMSGLTFVTGRWALRRHLKRGIAKFRQLMAGFELISTKSDVKTERVSDQGETIRNQSSTHEPLLELNEEESGEELHVQSKGRDRS